MIPASAFPSPFGNSLQAGFRFNPKVKKQIRINEVAFHQVKVSQIGILIPLVDEPCFVEHAGKNNILVDGSVLHRSLIRIPDDLLVLFEPAEKQMDLHHRPSDSYRHRNPPSKGCP